MTREDLAELFEKYKDEFLQFGKVRSRRTNRPDLHAFLLLDELVPSGRGTDMISGAEHDEFFLSPDLDQLAEAVTEEQVIELIRCGVMLSEYDCFSMYA